MRLGRGSTLALLFLAVITVLSFPVVGKCQAGKAPSSVPMQTREPSKATAVPLGLAPDAFSLVYQLLLVALGGFIATGIHILWKFRQYWSPGAFRIVSIWGYMAFGGAVAAVARAFLYKFWHPSNQYQLVTDILGVLVTALFPLGSRPPDRPGIDGNGPGYLQISSSRNEVCALFEETIRVRLQKLLQAEIKLLAGRYSWATIKYAGRQAWDDLMLSSPQAPEFEKAEIAFITGLPTTSDGHSDFDRKYRTLYHFLRHCTFRGLRRHLEEKDREGSAWKAKA